MRAVFLDTVGLLALWDEFDQWHDSAQRAYNLFSAAPVRLVTTTYVLLECGNAAARRPYRRDVAELWLALERAGDLVRPSDAQVAGAWAAFAARSAGSAGIVDEVSFAVMRDLGVREAFTNDVHFRAEGFVTLMT